jgi:hypothetical protein
MLRPGLHGYPGGTAAQEMVVRKHQGPQSLATSSSAIRRRVCHSPAKRRTLSAQPLEASTATAVEREGLQVDGYPLHQGLCLESEFSRCIPRSRSLYSNVFFTYCAKHRNEIYSSMPSRSRPFSPPHSEDGKVPIGQLTIKHNVNLCADTKSAW